MVLTLIKYNSQFGRVGYFRADKGNISFINIPVGIEIKFGNEVYVSKDRTIFGDITIEENVTIVCFNCIFEDLVTNTLSKGSSLMLIGCSFAKNSTFYLEENSVLILEDKFETNNPADNVSNKPNIFGPDSLMTVEGLQGGFFGLAGQIISTTDITFKLKSSGVTDFQADLNLTFITDPEGDINQNKILIDCSDINLRSILPPININYLIKK